MKGMAMESRHVLLSVKPQYAGLLVDGVKTVELRRRFPLDLPKGTKCLVYATSPVCSVIGEVRVASVEKLSISKLWKKNAMNACIGWQHFKEYFMGVEEGCAIYTYAYLRYYQPIKLNKLGKSNLTAPQSYRYLHKKELSENLDT